MSRKCVFAIFYFGFFGYLFTKCMEIENQKKQHTKVLFTQAYSIIDCYTSALFSAIFYEIGAKHNHVNSQNVAMTFCLGKGHAIHTDFAAFSSERVYDLASFELKNRLKYFLKLKNTNVRIFLIFNYRKKL
jgi:hypothetical protein